MIQNSIQQGDPIPEARILYLDEDCLVINKVAGEATQGAEAGMRDLGLILGSQIGESPKAPGFLPTAVHRLDVPVSGATLFARTPKSLAFLNAGFAQGRIEKRYWAIVEKPPASLGFPETGELVHWIKTDTKRNKSMVYDEKIPEAKRGILQYRITGYGDHYLFLEIALLTGRRHQIRAQFAHLGMPIKGDLKYGARRSEKGGGIRLHSYSLSFPNPAGNGASIAVTALPPIRDRLWEAFIKTADPDSRL
jgi:23S rRNA pseudouridine1911/1915/1917 synthase